MTRRGLSLLFERLTAKKCVLVYSFNIAQFAIEAHKRGLNISGGSFAIDEKCGEVYGQYFHID